jgi:hypothetical protein
MATGILVELMETWNALQDSRSVQRSIKEIKQIRKNNLARKRNDVTDLLNSASVLPSDLEALDDTTSEEPREEETNMVDGEPSDTEDTFHLRLEEESDCEHNIFSSTDDTDISEYSDLKRVKETPDTDISEFSDLKRARKAPDTDISEFSDLKRARKAPDTNISEYPEGKRFREAPDTDISRCSDLKRVKEAPDSKLKESSFSDRASRKRAVSLEGISPEVGPEKKRKHVNDSAIDNVDSVKGKEEEALSPIHVQPAEFSPEVQSQLSDSEPLCPQSASNGGSREVSLHQHCTPHQSLHTPPHQHHHHTPPHMHLTPRSTILFMSTSDEHITQRAFRYVSHMLATSKTTNIKQMEKKQKLPNKEFKNAIRFFVDIEVIQIGKDGEIVDSGLKELLPYLENPDSKATVLRNDSSVNDLLKYESFSKRTRREKGLKISTLLSTPTYLEQITSNKYKTTGGSRMREFCLSGTKEECRKERSSDKACKKLHFLRITQRHTDESLGDCSFLNACFNRTTCKYVHYEIDESFDDPEDAKMFASRPKDTYFTLYPPQWINCDIRYLDFEVLGKFAVIMADPPWDIHMELPYGTMSDDEMRSLKVPLLQDEGLIFLWVTGRAMELGRECLTLWGYDRVDEMGEWIWLVSRWTR